MLSLLLSWCYNILMVTIKTNEREVRKALSRIPGAMQEATAAMLNVISTGAASRQKGNVQREMIVRGPYTLKSLVHYKASASKPIDRQNAIVGTKSPYLPVHDKGGKVKAQKKRIAVPTNKVRGKDRKKRVAARYRLDKMAGAFILRPNGGRLKRSAMFIREGKRGKLVKVRDLGAAAYTLKANQWHTEAIEKFGRKEMRRAVFVRESKRILGRVVKP